MRFTEDIDSYDVILRFCRDKVRRGGNLVAEKVVYSIDLNLAGDPPTNFKSIKKLILQRRWVQSSESFNQAVWYFGAKSVPLERKHFEPVTFDMQRDDKGHTLSAIALLALRRKLDSLTKFPSGGLVFRSELLRLVDTETWQSRDPELDRIVSGMKRYTTTGREKRTYYSSHPIRDRFLLADNEIYNLVCWAGGGKPCATGKCLEKAWVINIEPEQIRVFDLNDAEMSGQRLTVYLDAVFPSHLLLREAELKRYGEMIENGEKPTFEVGLPEGNDSVKRQVRNDIYSGNFGRFGLTGEKVLDIVDFREVFRKYKSAGFVGRTRLLASLDHLMDDATRTNPFVLLVGEPGIGKSALTAKWLSSRVDSAVWYFCEDKKRHRLNPSTFTRHVLASLNRLYSIGTVDLKCSLGSLIELLNKTIAAICLDTPRGNTKVLIVVDGLDECLGYNEEGLTIVDVLEALDPTDGLRVLLSSRDIPELARFREANSENVIRVIGNDRDNLQDIEEYLKSELALKDLGKRELKKLLERSEGNFLYATLCTKMIKEGEVSGARLLSNAPEGLTELYEWKLELIKKRVRNSDLLDRIWLVLRTISLLPINPSREEVCTVLDLDPLGLPEILGPLQPLLAIDESNRTEGLRWFHKSFNDFVLDKSRLTEENRRVVYSRVIESCKRGVRQEQWHGISGLVPGGLINAYSRIADAIEVVDYARKEYFPAVLANPRLRSESYLVFSEAVETSRIARKNRLIEDMIFFKLLTWSLEYLILQVWGDGDLPLRRIRTVERKLRLGSDPKLRISVSMDGFLQGVITNRQLSEIVLDVVLSRRDEFSNLKTIIDVCNTYARECAALAKSSSG